MTETTQTNASTVLDALEAQVSAATDAELDPRGKLMITGLVVVVRDILQRTASIDESLKSIAASQVIVAKEAEVSLEMLEEAKSGEPSADQAEVDNWREETL